MPDAPPDAVPDPVPDPGPGPAAALRRERTALLGSAVAAGVIGTAAAVWGVVAGSGVILFDGVYTVAGIALVGVSALASRAAEQAPGRRYPFGRHAATPLAVAMQGAALVATLLYGVADAVGTLVAGGADGDPLGLLAYGVASAVLSAGVAAWLRRRAPDSELALAEVVSWRAGAWLSAGVALGGVVGTLLDRGGHATAAGYVDPVLLLLAVVLIAPLPVRLVRDGMHELLEGAPPPEVALAVDAAVAAARAEFDLPEALVRAQAGTPAVRRGGLRRGAGALGRGSRGPGPSAVNRTFPRPVPHHVRDHQPEPPVVVPDGRRPGAAAGGDAGRAELAPADGDVADELDVLEVGGPEDRDARQVLERRRREVVGVADPADARVGVETGDERVAHGRAPRRRRRRWGGRCAQPTTR